MGFEAKILKAVEEKLGAVPAAFAHGTLFVEDITKEETELVVEAIREVIFPETDVIVSGPIVDRFGSEYAFDIA
jgi:hypothetical protein